MKNAIGMLTILTLLLAGGGRASADFIYSTGFEAPTFIAGAINGQGGWSGDGTIQSSIVESGSQALLIANSGTSLTLAEANLSLNYAVGDQTLIVSVGFLEGASSSGGSQAGISIIGDTGFVAQIYEYDNVFSLGNANQATNSSLSLSTNTWYQLEMVLNFQTETVTGYVDGILLGSLSINPSNPTNVITGVGLYDYTFGGSQNQYFDNLQIATTPAPASLTLLGIGITCIYGYGIGRRKMATA